MLIFSPNGANTYPFCGPIAIPMTTWPSPWPSDWWPWGQQYLQQILPRKVEEVSVLRWAVTVTMSLMLAGHCHEPSILGVVDTIHQHHKHDFGDGSLVHIGTMLDHMTLIFHIKIDQNWWPLMTTGVPSLTPRRGEGLVAQAAGTPQAGLICDAFIGRLGEFKVLLVAEPGSYSNSHLEATRRQ